MLTYTGRKDTHAMKVVLMVKWSVSWTLSMSAIQETEMLVSSSAVADTARGGPGTVWRPARQERMAGEKVWHWLARPGGS